MKKRIFQRIIELFLSLGFLTVVCVLDGMSWGQLVDNLTFLGLAVWAFILFDDLIAKVFWYRYAITKPYLLYEGLYALSLVCMTGAFLAKQFYWTIGQLIFSIVLFAGALAYHVICYKDKKYTSFEIERAKWFIILERLGEFETQAELQEKLYNFLRFHTKRDMLKTGLDISRPLDITGANRTIAEMLKDDPSDENAFAAQEYVENMVTTYWQLTHKDGGTK